MYEVKKRFENYAFFTNSYDLTTTQNARIFTVTTG